MADEVEEEGEEVQATYTGTEAAERLGIPYGKLWRIVNWYDVPVERRRRSYIWNDDVLQRVRELLNAGALVQPERPPGPSSQEVCELLGIPYGTLMETLKIVRKKGGDVERSGPYLIWTDEAIETVRAVRREVEEEAAWRRDPRGLTAQAAAASLGLSANQLTLLAQRHGIEVPRRGRSWVWDEASIEKVRAVLGSLRRRPERSGKEAAATLGVSYAKLLKLVRLHRIPHTRKDGFIVWGDEVLAEVRLLLSQGRVKRPARHAVHAESSSTEPGPKRQKAKAGLSTLEVCRELGMDYPAFLSVIRPLQAKLPLERQGRRLVWTPEAIAVVRDALSSRSAKADDLLEKGGRSRSGLERLTRLQHDLQELVAELVKPAATAFFINSLPSQSHVLPFPVQALVYRLPTKGFRAVLADLDLEAQGPTPHKALRNLRVRLWDRYCEVQHSPSDHPEEWSTLVQLIVPERTF